jgi:hypothetical protein
MKSIEQVISVLQDKLSALESQRKELLQRRQEAMVWAWGIAGVGGVLSLIGLLIFIIPGLICAAVTAIVAIVVYGTKVTSIFNQYRSEFKQNFIRELLAANTDQLLYAPEGDQRALSEYFRSELFPRKPDREKVEDTIFAKLGASDLVASEIHTEYKQVSRDKDGKETVSWHTIFQGLFVSADFHKEFQGRTFVRTDVAEKMLGAMGRFFQKPVFSKLQLVQLEDVEFEREFVVHSDSQIEARYILSPSMMRRMLELKNKFSSQIEFTFLESRVFLAISHTKDFFEPDIHQSLFNQDYLRGYIFQVQLVLGIVEDLDLNTRLWTKH